ncbi:MAG: TetR/AcrR family transcriptional regulator [Eubacteriaceae bacterium]|jgi:AcrR family transcriptional regulator|nr:TetR/AcrR family transcriptional regulator [Eubacteriaceae bacterium]
MEDLRIKKTKEKIHNGLIELLGEESFEHITVTDLCKRSGVTRITFYAYYDDKYALTAEIFGEMYDTAAVIFRSLQKSGNEDEEPVESCSNMLSAVFEMQEQYGDFLEKLPIENNSYMAFAYYWNVMRRAEEQASEYIKMLRPKYDPGMITNMICSGVWGFVRTGISEGRETKKIIDESKSLLRSMLKNKDIFE